MSKWQCANPSCNQSMDWHSRRMEYLENTIGMTAAQEFEQDHPEVEVEDE